MASFGPITNWRSIARQGLGNTSSIYWCWNIGLSGAIGIRQLAGFERRVLRPGRLFRAGSLSGMPLGMLEMASYGVEEIQLLSGGKIVIFSDGLSEAENTEGQFFDRSGLKETIQPTWIRIARACMRRS
jgi:hypothetical protein